MSSPAGLDDLSTEELRVRAFHRAERRLDVGFFLDLLKHVPAAAGLAAEDGSAGNIGGSISEVIEAVREVLGHGLGDSEPLLRARYLDYLREPAD